jgi:ABC-type multidrug transport system fused ATPase/permease subunit
MKDIYENWNLYKEEVELLQELENIFLEYDNEVLNEGMMDKINDFFLKLSMRVVDLAKTAGRAALKLLGGAIKIVNRFSEKYPTLAKIIGSIIVVGGAYVVMATLDPSVAQADVVFDGKLLSQEELDAFEGAVKSIEIFDTKREGMEIAARLRKLHNSANVTELNSNMEGLNGDVASAMARIREYAEENPERYEKLVKAGENFSFSQRVRGGTLSTQAID